MEILKERVAKNIRAAVYGAGFNASDLAKALNCSRQSVSRKIRGEVAFTFDEIEATAGWLNVSISTLLGLAEITQ